MKVDTHSWHNMYPTSLVYMPCILLDQPVCWVHLGYGNKKLRLVLSFGWMTNMQKFGSLFFKLLFESKQNIVVCGFVTVHKSAEAQGIWKVRTKRPPLIVIPSLSLCKIRRVFIIRNNIQKWLLETPGPPLIVVPSVSLRNININININLQHCSWAAKMQ